MAIWWWLFALVVLVVSAQDFPLNDMEPDGRPFYLVMGAESTGNRYLVSMLMSMGCSGASGHEQPFDYSRDRHPDWPAHIRWDYMLRRHFVHSRCFVMHRSLPHALQWVDPMVLVDRLLELGFRPWLLVPKRNITQVLDSQVRNGHVHNRTEAYRNLEDYQVIMEKTIPLMELVHVPVVPVEHSELKHQYYIDQLAETLELSAKPLHKLPRFKKSV